MTVKPSAFRHPIVRAVLILAALLAVAKGWQAIGAAEWLERRALVPIRGFGIWGWLAAILVYVVGTVLLIPGTAVTLALGELYGPWLGFALASTGATLGAAAAFGVARTFARDRARRWAAGDSRLEAVDRAVAEHGAWVVLLLRLNPAVPFNVLNYALGVTRIGFWPYLLASWLGMLPGGFLYVMIGVGFRPSGRAGGLGPWGWGAVVLTTFLATAYIGKLARDALAEPGQTAETRGTPECMTDPSPPSPR